MIICEGLDNTGKTTLVEKLKADFPQLHHHPSIGNKHDLKQIRDQAWDCLKVDKTQPLTLWDRSRLISEYIYNPILRARDFAYSEYSWWHMMTDFVRRPQLIIWCRRDYEKIIDSFDEREQLSGVKENLYDLYYGYERVMGFLEYWFEFVQQGKSILLRYDFEETSYDTVKFWVEEYIARVQVEEGE